VISLPVHLIDGGPLPIRIGGKRKVREAAGFLFAGTV
jgi:hypothetical protein